MSDQPDRESKTEQPTEKKLTEAFEQGNKPFSMEVVTFGSFLGLLCVCGLIAGDSASRLSQSLAILIGNAGTVSFAVGGDAALLLKTVFADVAWITLPALVVMALGGVLGSLAQNQPGAAIDRVIPKLNRLSPASQARNMFGKDGLIRFASTIVKCCVVTAIAAYALRNNFDRVLLASAGDVAQIPEILLETFKAIVFPLCFAAMLICIVDMLRVRIKWHSDMMMTRQQVKDELKQSEGDTQIKQRMKLLGRQRLNRRMMADVQKATFAIVNPTHYAIALRYVASEGGAPLVLAKGVDHIALKIRESCETSQIPLVENKPLARSLYAAVEVGEMIPVEFYRAVAEVIHFVEMRKRLAAPRA